MATLQSLMAQVTRCDTWTQLSVFGSWSFIVNAACINQASRFVPDEPVDNGIESFTPYEAARRALIKEAEDGNSRLPALLALQRDITGLIYEANGEARGLQSTFEFMTSNAPKRSTFESDYDNRVRMGLKPGMSKRQFVDAEYDRAMAQHNQLVARGEDAVRVCETITIDDDRGYNDLPEWVTESFQRKLVEKLHNRWEKLELVRTNPRRQRQIRDAAAADQMMIVQVLAEHNEIPGFSDSSNENYELETADQASIDRQQATSLADMPNDLPFDPTAPGPVTVTRFIRVPKQPA